MQSGYSITATANDTWPRDPDYYMSNVIFLVEGTLFRVPRHYFAKYSDIFSSVFSLPPGDGNTQEGTSDQNPFRLEGVSKADFKSLLKVMYPLHTPPAGGDVRLSKDEWISVLKLATMWNFRDIRTLATAKLGSQGLDLSPIDRILLGKEYKVPEWLRYGYHEIVRRPPMITHEEAARLGLETTLLLGHVREEVARHEVDFAYRRREDQNFMDLVNKAFQGEIKEVEAANRAFDGNLPSSRQFL